MEKRTEMKARFLGYLSDSSKENSKDEIIEKLVNELQGNEPDIWQDEYTEYEVFFEDEDALVTFQDYLRTFNVIFSENEELYTELPLDAILRRIAKTTYRLNKEINDALELLNTKRKTQAEKKYLKVLCDSIIEAALNENSDFGLSLVEFLLPSDSYFIKIGKQITLEILDAYKLRETDVIPFKTIYTVPNNESIVKAVYDEYLILTIDIDAKKLSECDVPVRISIKRKDNTVTIIG